MISDSFAKFHAHCRTLYEMSDDFETFVGQLPSTSNNSPPATASSQSRLNALNQDLVQSLMEAILADNVSKNKCDKVKLSSEAIIAYTAAINLITDELIARSVDCRCAEGNGSNNELNESHLFSVMAQVLFDV
ncbi:hypothetical protein ACOME3_000334 [Neoechinorhynchus agilis]